MCFDFNDLGANSAIMQKMQKEAFYWLKHSIANNMVGYQKVDCEYQAEAIYSKL